MTTFYLIRHAEAEGNLYRRMHGQYETMITPNGMKQIRATAKRFLDIPIDVCYASDLLRTRTTAQAICVPKNLPLHPEPAFRELAVGEWDNLDFGWLHTYAQESLQSFNHDPQNWHVQGSEPFGVYTGRFIRALTELGQHHPGQSVAVFSHAAVLRGVFMTLFPALPPMVMDNTAVSKLEYEDGVFRPVYLCDSSHLSEEISTMAHNRATKGNNPIWFQRENDWTYTVMALEEPAGVLHLQDLDADTGILAYMRLLPQWRGCGRSVQLLGKAVFTFRDMGKKKLVFRDPDGALESLCRRMSLVPDDQGVYTMDIQLRMLPFSM